MQAEPCGELAAGLHVGGLVAPHHIAQHFLNRIAAEGQVHHRCHHLEAGHGFLQRALAAHEAEAARARTAALMQSTGGRAIGCILEGEKFLLAVVNDLRSDRCGFAFSGNGLNQCLRDCDQAWLKRGCPCRQGIMGAFGDPQLRGVGAIKRKYFEALLCSPLAGFIRTFEQLALLGQGFQPAQEGPIALGGALLNRLDQCG